jgi:hypothetical protein
VHNRVRSVLRVRSADFNLLIGKRSSEDFPSSTLKKLLQLVRRARAMAQKIQ